MDFSEVLLQRMLDFDDEGFGKDVLDLSRVLKFDETSALVLRLYILLQYVKKLMYIKLCVCIKMCVFDLILFQIRLV